MYKNLEKEGIRIAFVVTAEITANTFVRKFAEYVAKQGFEVLIIADNLIQDKYILGHGTLTLLPVRMERHPSLKADLRSLFEIFRVLKRWKPGVVVFATPKAALLASISSFFLRIPIRVYQIWGLRLETTTGIQRLILRVFEIITSSLATKVLANSRSLAAKYRSLRLNKFHGVDVLGEGSSHGVDTEYFSDAVELPNLDTATATFLAGRSENITVGFVGRLHPDKGIDTLLKAVEVLTEKSIPINLLLIGADEGAEVQGGQMTSPNVLRIDHVDDVRPYYAVMDVLVLPSLREGFPNVVLEASSMSVPSIVSNGTGVIDSVIDGVTGFVVDVGDSQGIANALEKLVNDRALVSQLGAAARVRVENDFRQKQVWDRTLRYILE